MEISPSTAALPQPQLATSGKKGALSSDFETFLNMLTTQMQNQDPLEPMKSDELSVQLATFSGVEQQVLTNDLLAGLGKQFAINGLSQTAAWVGMDARSTAPVPIGEEPIEASFKSVGGADVDAVVRSVSGAEIFRERLPAGASTFTWNGAGAPTTILPGTTYQLSVERFSEGKLIGSEMAQTYANIREVRVEHGQNVLVLDGGSKIHASDVTALRGS